MKDKIYKFMEHNRKVMHFMFHGKKFRTRKKNRNQVNKLRKKFKSLF